MNPTEKIKIVEDCLKYSPLYKYAKTSVVDRDECIKIDAKRIVYALAKSTWESCFKALEEAK